MAEINDMANGNAEPVSVASAPFMMAADVSRLREMTPGEVWALLNKSLPNITPPPLKPADREADLDAEETTDMANPVSVNAELRGDAPTASTGKVLSFPDRQGSTKPAPIKQPYPSKREAALDLARRGIPVFPLKPNEKTPAIINWQELATTDPERIKKCWSEDPKRNIGIPTDGFVVVDIRPPQWGRRHVLRTDRHLHVPDRHRL